MPAQKEQVECTVLLTVCACECFHNFLGLGSDQVFFVLLLLFGFPILLDHHLWYCLLWGRLHNRNNTELLSCQNILIIIYPHSNVFSRPYTPLTFVRKTSLLSTFSCLCGTRTFPCFDFTPVYLVSFIFLLFMVSSCCCEAFRPPIG